MVLLHDTQSHFLTIVTYSRSDNNVALPLSVKETIANNSPIIGTEYDTNLEWLSNYNNHIYRNSLFLKGPLLIPEFSELTRSPSFLNLEIYNKSVKKIFVDNSGKRR